MKMNNRPLSVWWYAVISVWFTLLNAKRFMKPKQGPLAIGRRHDSWLRTEVWITVSWIQKQKMKRAKLIENKRIEWLIYSKILTGCWSACGLTELFRSEKICRFATATVNIAFTFIWSGVKGPRWNKSHASTTSALTIVRWQIANVTHRLKSVCEVINKFVDI